MKNLKIISLLSFTIFLLSCKNKTVREDIIHRFPNNKIDTILDFDFDRNKITDYVCVLDMLKNKNSILDNKQAILLYMNNKFVSKNDNVLPKSTFGWQHMINLKNMTNKLVIYDNFSTNNPVTNYRLVFTYNRLRKKILLDSIFIDGKIENEKGMPYFKNILKKKIFNNIEYSIDKGNFLTQDSLDFKNF